MTDLPIAHPVALLPLGALNGGTPVAIPPARMSLMKTAHDNRRRCPVCGDGLILSGWCDSCLRYRPLAQQTVKRGREG